MLRGVALAKGVASGDVRLDKVSSDDARRIITTLESFGNSTALTRGMRADDILRNELNRILGIKETTPKGEAIQRQIIGISKEGERANLALLKSQEEFARTADSVMHGFKTLVDGLAGIPREIIMETRVDHHITINGAEVLNRIIPQLREMVIDLIGDKIDYMLKKKFPKVGPLR
jgi:hypothetical protein